MFQFHRLKSKSELLTEINLLWLILKYISAFILSRNAHQ